MQVVVHDIETQFTRFDRTEERVHVGTVHIHQTAAVVNGFNDIHDFALEQAECVRDGNHHTGNGVIAMPTRPANLQHHLEDADGRNRADVPYLRLAWDCTSWYKTLTDRSLYQWQS